MKRLFEKALPLYPPPSFLPYHPIIELLSDTGILLEKCIRFLGLLDVSTEIKKIIAQKQLKTLQAHFDGEEIDFMNKEAKADRPILSSMGLISYNGDKEKLDHFILNRGLYRFAQGIKDAPSQYSFYFTYLLPKALSDQLNHLLRQKPQYALSYRGWQEDALITWRFLCTYSK